MARSHAAALLEDPTCIGLTMSSAIERAYRKDTKLLWKLVACFVRVNEHIRNIRGRLAQVMSYCKYFRPYFKDGAYVSWIIQSVLHFDNCALPIDK